MPKIAVLLLMHTALTNTELILVVPLMHAATASKELLHGLYQKSQSPSLMYAATGNTELL